MVAINTKDPELKRLTELVMPADTDVATAAVITAAMATALQVTHEGGTAEASDRAVLGTYQCAISEARRGLRSIEEGHVVQIDYTNHKGVRRFRYVIPIRLIMGCNEWHPDTQYLLYATDLEKHEVRTFAMDNVHKWTPIKRIEDCAVFTGKSVPPSAV